MKFGYFFEKIGFYGFISCLGFFGCIRLVCGFIRFFIGGASILGGDHYRRSLFFYVALIFYSDYHALFSWFYRLSRFLPELTNTFPTPTILVYIFPILSLIPNFLV